VPEGFENIFTLALVLVIFQGSNALIPETGVISVIVAGLVVGNVRSPVQRELKEFKEQLTVLLIGMLFVLLAAEVRLASVVDLGLPGLLVVLTLIFLVRPFSILVCTWGTDLTWRDKIFLAWVAPRGIVAAAISALFVGALNQAGLPGGEQLQALVFLVIAVTVVIQGATAEFLARGLGLRRATGQGYAILGAHPLARLLGGVLRDAGEKVILIDADATTYQEATEEGCRVVYGNGLQERVLLGAGIESRKAVIGALTNGAMNLLFARKARQEYKVPAAYVGIQRGSDSLNPDLVHEGGGTVLFGQERDLELWSVRIRRGHAEVQIWQWQQPAPPEEASATHPSPTDQPAPAEKSDSPAAENSLQLPQQIQSGLLPLALSRGDTIKPVDDTTRLKDADTVYWLVLQERESSAQEWLTGLGWRRPEPVETIS
jgi:hypothetical protein